MLSQRALGNAVSDPPPHSPALPLHDDFDSLVSYVEQNQKSESFCPRARLAVSQTDYLSCSFLDISYSGYIPGYVSYSHMCKIRHCLLRDSLIGTKDLQGVLRGFPVASALWKWWKTWVSMQRFHFLGMAPLGFPTFVKEPILVLPLGVSLTTNEQARGAKSGQWAGDPWSPW